MLTMHEALSQLLGSVRVIRDVETLPVSQTNGRVLARTQSACVTVPDADNSAMDGYAFRYADLSDVAGVLTVTQRIPAGSLGTRLGKGKAARIFTGAPLPEGADTVVRQEWCLVEGKPLVPAASTGKGRSCATCRRAGKKRGSCPDGGYPIACTASRRRRYRGVGSSAGCQKTEGGVDAYRKRTGSPGRTASTRQGL